MIMIDNTTVLQILYMRKVLKAENSLIAETLNVGRNTVTNICKRYNLPIDDIKKIYEKFKNDGISDKDLDQYFAYKKSGSLTDKEKSLIKEICKRELNCYLPIPVYCNYLIRRYFGSLENLYDYDSNKKNRKNILKDPNYKRNENDVSNAQCLTNMIDNVTKVWYKKGLPKNYKDVFVVCREKGITCSDSKLYKEVSQYWTDDVSLEWKKILDEQLPVCQYLVKNYSYNECKKIIEEYESGSIE